MLRYSPTAAIRFSRVTLTDKASEDEGALAAVMWRALDLCAAAEHRAHAIHCIDSTHMLAALTVLVADNVNTPIIGQLTAHYPALTRSLKVLKIIGTDLDEGAALDAFAALATHLRDLSFLWCDLASVRGLAGRCEYLRKVVLHCEQLRSLDGLEDHVYLEELDASFAPIASVAPLLSCPSLTKVTLNFCRRLTSLDDLQHHPRLEEFTARHATITSVEPLRTCPALTKVILNSCKQLTSLAGLEDHQRLEEVDAAFTAIHSVEPLLSCPALRKVDVSNCQRLPSDINLSASIDVIR